MFGKIQETPQKETTRFYPRSPYGVSKTFAHYIAVNYREAFNIYASCGIMFNHESPRRGEEFVTRKITKGISEFKKTGKKMTLGNLNASRDWGYARDYMEGAYGMLQQDRPDDYILATGKTHTVKQWLEKSCEVAGIDYWECFTQDATFERQAEVDYLRGDASKAQEKLAWAPRVDFNELVEMMVKADEAQLSHTL